MQRLGLLKLFAKGYWLDYALWAAFVSWKSVEKLSFLFLKGKLEEVNCKCEQREGHTKEKWDCCGWEEIQSGI